MNQVKEKMELIQTTFQEAKRIAVKESDLENLNKALQNFPNEFISVAYEGASMGVAIKSIEDTNSLKKWSDFYHYYGMKHSSQIHVGLGWAFSELDLVFSDFELIIEPLLQYRVIDGYGYYEGVFKKRKSIRMQESPQHFNQLNLKAYNQGLGRSLWYTAQGKVAKLIQLISRFPENRRHDLWRGIGIAVAYVGGIEISVLQKLVNESNRYLSSFKCGVSLLVQSRHKAETIVNDTNIICDFLFGLSCATINDQLIDIEKETGSTSELLYFDWLKNIELNFSA